MHDVTQMDVRNGKRVFSLYQFKCSLMTFTTNGNDEQQIENVARRCGS